MVEVMGLDEYAWRRMIYDYFIYAIYKIKLPV